MVLKSHYPIPEIWLRRDDQAAADKAALGLRDAGLSVRVAPTDAFATLPAQAVVESFAFHDDGLALAMEREDVVLPYDVPVVVVACSPRETTEEGARAPGDRASTAVRAFPDVEGSGARGVFADVYMDAGGRLLRCGVTANHTDFSSLPGTNVSGPSGKLSRFLMECEGRFRRLTVDRRLLHLQPRRKQAPPPPGVQRKGFAFGTPALVELLKQIAPAAHDMSQCELSSRLVYLTLR